MATNFPGSLDSYVNPVGSDGLASGAGGVSHANMHANIHDAVEAIQAKVGVDNSTVSSSLDYRVGLTERGAPVGAISMFAGVAAPTGWLLCQGQEVDYATYPLLGAVFGVSGGTWYLPDLRQRVPVGSGAGYALLGSGGSATDSVTITQANLPEHTHNMDHGHADTISANQSGHTHTISVTVNDNGTDLVQRLSGYTGNYVIPYDGNNNGYADGLESYGNYNPSSPTPTTQGMAVTYTSSHGHTASGSATSTDPAITVSGGVTDHTGSTGDGNFANTALSIDVVQPFFVVNFIIRVDDI